MEPRWAREDRCGFDDHSVDLSQTPSHAQHPTSLPTSTSNKHPQEEALPRHEVRSLADSSYDDAISNVALPASATAAVTAASAHSHPSRTQSDTVQPSGKIEATDSKHAKKRKLYLCGKCGVPKRGHICSNPDVTESRDESSTIGATLSDSSKKYNKVYVVGPMVTARQRASRR